MFVKQVCDSNMDGFEVLKSKENHVKKICDLPSIYSPWVKLLKPLFTMFASMSNWQYTWLFQDVFVLPILIVYKKL